jgi:hypothetical protein
LYSSSSYYYYYYSAAATRQQVSLVHGGWADGAQTRTDFTVASLLDSMDWMPDSMIAENMARLYPQMSDGTGRRAKKKGVIFWRSFATKVHSPVLAALRPELVPDLDGSERVGWYLSQWVAPVYPHDEIDFGQFLNKGSGQAFANTAAQDAKVIFAMASHALRSEKDTVEFYKSQVTERGKEKEKREEEEEDEEEKKKKKVRREESVSQSDSQSVSQSVNQS